MSAFENEVKQLTTQIDNKDDLNKKLQNDMDNMGNVFNQKIETLGRQDI